MSSLLSDFDEKPTITLTRDEVLTLLELTSWWDDTGYADTDERNLIDRLQAWAVDTPERDRAWDRITEAAGKDDIEVSSRDWREPSTVAAEEMLMSSGGDACGSPNSPEDAAKAMDNDTVREGRIRLLAARQGPHSEKVRHWTRDG
jgi:hypothetical protein